MFIFQAQTGKIDLANVGKGADQNINPTTSDTKKEKGWSSRIDKDQVLTSTKGNETVKFDLKKEDQRQAAFEWLKTNGLTNTMSWLQEKVNQMQSAEARAKAGTFQSTSTMVDIEQQRFAQDTMFAFNDEQKSKDKKKALEELDKKSEGSKTDYA